MSAKPTNEQILVIRDPSHQHILWRFVDGRLEYRNTRDVTDSVEGTNWATHEERFDDMRITPALVFALYNLIIRQSPVI